MTREIKYSFVVPVYNDGYLAEEFTINFNEVFKKWLEIDAIESVVELIFVDDGSNNGSLDSLVHIQAKHAFVRVIELSRNYGQHIALSCGYEHAAGQFVGMMNIDMEDPPDQIPVLLSYIREHNCDIVYGLRKKRESPVLDRLTSQIFQYVLNKLTGNDFPLNTSTLRVMNRKFVDAYNSLNEKSRYIPGLEMWIGFKRGFTNIQHQVRKKGRSSYNLRRRFKMAFEAIISFSDLPLRWVIMAGFSISGIGFLLTSILIVQRLFFVSIQPGFTSTVSLIVLFSGIQMILLGMVGLYVGRILKEVQNRPLYIIRNKFNF